MSAPAPHRTGTTTHRHSLVRRRIDWPLTAEKLYDAITVPRGFRKELSYGRLRIGHSGGRADQKLRDLAERLADELPSSVCLEIYAGRVVVTGTPRLAHRWAAAELTRQLQPVADARAWTNFPGAVVIPHLREHTNPDVMVARPGGPTFDEAYCGAAVPLVGEVTSPGTAHDDYGPKREFYGQAGVGIYLIVDTEREETVLHTRPYDKGYRDIATLEFGARLLLPAPFEIALDTGAFRYDG
jgi:Uma2 family endonuclease